MHASITSCKISEKTNESISRKVHHRLSDPSEDFVSYTPPNTQLLKINLSDFGKILRGGRG